MRLKRYRRRPAQSPSWLPICSLNLRSFRRRALRLPSRKRPHHPRSTCRNQNPSTFPLMMRHRPSKPFFHVLYQAPILKTLCRLLPSVTEDGSDDGNVPLATHSRSRHYSTVSNWSTSHRIPGSWVQPSPVAEGRPSLEIAAGEFSPPPRTPRALEPSEAEKDKEGRCIIM